MRTYYLFGYLSDDIGEAKYYLENALSCKFDARESTYYGNYYQYGEKSGEHFILRENIDPFDDEVAEPDFPSYKILLYLNDVESPDAVVAKVVAGNVFLLLNERRFD